MNDEYFEKFFLWTVNDLRSRLQRGSEYDVIRSCGLCRQLVLDDDKPLLEMANANANVTLTFAIQNKIRVLNNGIELKPHLGFFPVVPFNIHFYVIDWKKIKKVPVMYWKKDELTFEKVIKAASNFMGGVHSRNPKADNPQEQALNALYTAFFLDRDLAITALKNICHVVLTGVEPLESKIIEHTPAGGL
jgi:hypothetical protein